MTTINLHSVSFQLQEPHKFDWLVNMGEVFAVFDQQDSGNISFGIKDNSGKKFVKYAGAKPLEYGGDPQEAVERLKQAVSIYNDLDHPHLMKLIEHFSVPEGYVAVFDWFEGESLHPHWSFPPPAKYKDPNSPYYRYKQLSIETRLKSLDNIFSFHLHVAKKGYVAVDFYDGSILYDFLTNTTKICDIDVYQKKPFINRMGRLWGSSRFMSPEEYKLGADIDEITNVFNMGAIAFSLVGGELDRSFSKWEAGRDMFEVAIKAVDPDRERRLSSIAEFYNAWKLAQHNK
jgi:serine/threonine-protein kinase